MSQKKKDIITDVREDRYIEELSVFAYVDSLNE